MEKLAVEQENRSLRDSNFELQSKARAAETHAKRMQAEVADKERQLRIMTDQNSELLRLLESEESLTGLSYKVTCQSCVQNSMSYGKNMVHY